MTSHNFNDEWGVREPVGPFAAVQGTSVEVKPVTLPHDALRDAPRSPDAPGRGAGAYFPTGAFTYLKSFEVPAEWRGKLVRLEFDGAMRHAMIYVNDELAGNRADGYTRFWVDLTPYLRFDEINQLRVEVRTGQDSRWYSGTGLIRDVALHVDDAVHIAPDGFTVTTLRLEDDQAVIEVATQVTNAGLTTAIPRLSTTIVSPEDEDLVADAVPVTVPPGGTSLVRQRFYLPDPALWSAEIPALHTARLRLDADAQEPAAVSVSFGIRTVVADPRKGLLVNGESVLLRGACIHHDNGPLGAAAVRRAEERRIELLKQAGFNAVRAAHNPLSPAMLEACDRLGMYVMDEAFDMWVRGKTHYDYAMDFPQWWRADLEALVAKDRNHPSVIMYSLGNEIAEVGTPHGAHLAREMAEQVRLLDPTRLITNGVNSLLAVMDEFAESIAEGGGLNETMAGGEENPMSAAARGENVTRRTAESHSVLDVVGLNYGESRYELDRDLFPRRVIVGSETFPAMIGTLWQLVEQHPHVIGDFTWTGWDYLGEVGIGSHFYLPEAARGNGLEREYPWLTAWCGDIDITGHRRPMSYYRETVFGLRQKPYIAILRPERRGAETMMTSPWAWSDSVSSWTWPGHESAVVDVEVYADADEVILELDGEQVARVDVGMDRPRLATAEIAYRPGELVAVALRAGKEVGRTSLHTAGDPVLRAEADRDVLSADPSDLAFVALELVDGNGRLVASATAEVSVAVSGAGALAGMCSADPATEERFDASTWRTFDGRALAVIRPTGTGSITVTASAPGYDSVTVELLSV